MLTLISTAAAFACGWFAHRYREKFLRIKDGIAKVIETETKPPQ